MDKLLSKPDMMEQLQKPGPALNAQRVERLSAPLAEMGMEVTLDQLIPYDKDPRIDRNPAYDEIRESIRHAGLKHPPVITQRPGDDKYMIRDGGNTRLAILNELYQETGDERFYRFWCIYKPWVSEQAALAGHLSENENRGDLTWIQKALGLVQLKQMLEAEAGEPLSQNALARRCTELGFSISQSHISRMLYTVEHIWPSLPTVLRTGMGHAQIKTFISYREALLEIWKRTEAKPVEAFDAPFHEVISKFDYEDATELPWSIVEDRLLGMMSEQTGAHLNTIDYTLKEIFTYKKRRQSIDDPQLWEPLMKEMERVRDPEAHPLQFYPPLPGDKPEPQKRPRRTQDADPPPQAALPQDDTGNTGSTGSMGSGDNEETARLKAEIERLKAENARIAQQEVLRQRQAPAPLATLEQPYAGQEGEPRHHAAEDLDSEADRLLGLDSSAASLERESDRGQGVSTPLDDTRTDGEKRASLTLSPVDEPDSKRALRHRVSEMHGGEAGDFEDFAVKAIPLMCNGPLMPITDIWWIDAYQRLRPTLRFQVFRLAQVLGQWAGFPLDGDNEDEIPILRTPKDGIGYELNPLPPHLESDPRAQRIWQLLAALQGEALQPLYPTEATLIGELLGTADVDSGAPHHPFQMPDEILVRFFRLVRLVRVLRTLPEEPEEGEE
ncbi:ParB family protein [Azotobacter vinelandii]|uniref:ParB family protein n=1 Tax=Azotobacter vinelandii TaxID=354 RepID=UPI0018D4A681|nr:ParB family protein [Azotobacter vinelandii]